MEIESIPISEVIPYENNPRKNDKAVDIVAKSIKEFGFKQPIVIDKNNVIIAGHTRMKAHPIAITLLEEVLKTEIEDKKQREFYESNLRELQEGIDIIWADDLTPEQVKAYRIMDNKSAEYAEWDLDKLKTEILELGDMGFDLKLTGFSSDDISDFLGKEIKEDDFEIPTESKYDIRLGEIYMLGEHRLMCGDSTKKENVDGLMNEEKAILMVTDPPYGVNYNPKWRDDADKKGILGNRYPTRAIDSVTNDDIIDWRETYSLFDCDVVYNWHASWFTSKVQTALESCDYNIIASIIWVKPHFALSQGDYHWQHEPCWYAVKKGKNHNWQGSRKESTIWEIAGMNAMGGSHDENDKRTGHGTQKPIECMKKPILNNSSEGQLITDPFGGSGSTLIVCEQLNRKCYMMEIDPFYCSVIIERWEKLTGKKAVKL